MIDIKVVAQKMLGNVKPVEYHDPKDKNTSSQKAEGVWSNPENSDNVKQRLIVEVEADPNPGNVLQLKDFYKLYRKNEDILEVLGGLLKKQPDSLDLKIAYLEALAETQIEENISDAREVARDLIKEFITSDSSEENIDKVVQVMGALKNIHKAAKVSLDDRVADCIEIMELFDKDEDKHLWLEGFSGAANNTLKRKVLDVFELEMTGKYQREETKKRAVKEVDSKTEKYERSRDPIKDGTNLALALAKTGKSKDAKDARKILKDLITEHKDDINKVGILISALESVHKIEREMAKIPSEESLKNKISDFRELEEILLCRIKLGKALGEKGGHDKEINQIIKDILKVLMELGKGNKEQRKANEDKRQVIRRNLIDLTSATMDSDGASLTKTLEEMGSLIEAKNGGGAQKVSPRVIEGSTTD